VRLGFEAALAAELEHAIRQAAQEGAIVRDDSIVPSNSPSAGDQHLLGRQIEVVRRLVEDEEVRRIEEHAGHRQPRLLAADSARIGFCTSSPGNWKAPSRLRRTPMLSLGKSFCICIPDGERRVEQVERLLREVAIFRLAPSVTEPVSGGQRRRRPSSAAVDLPAPLRPIRTSRSPRGWSGSAVVDTRGAVGLVVVSITRPDRRSGAAAEVEPHELALPRQLDLLDLLERLDRLWTCAALAACAEKRSMKRCSFASHGLLAA
jgi:hypothetical protein